MDDVMAHLTEVDAPAVAGAPARGPDVLAGFRGAVTDPAVRRLLDNVSDAILVYTVDGTVVWASEALRREFGYSVADVIGTPLRLAHPDDEADATRAATEAALDGRDEVTVRMRLASTAGEQRWADLTSRFVRDDDGAVEFAVATLRDVTSMVRAETHYRLLAENASDVVFEMGLDGRVLWASPSVERELGWRPDDIIGRDATELTHPDDLPAVRQARELDRRGAALVTRLRFRRGDADAGTEADTDFVWVSGVSHDVRDSGDRLISRVVIFNLEPDELRIERGQRRAEQARMRAVLDSELDPRVVLEAVRDREGTIIDFLHVDVNRAAADWLGAPVAELVGESMSALFPAAMRVPLVESYATVVETGDPLVLDETPMPQLLGDGEPRWFDVRAARIDDGLTVSWRDVTDRHLVAAEMAASEERYRLLALNVQEVVLHVVADEIRWASPSLTEVLGWSPEEWIGRRTTELIHPDDLAAVAGSRVPPRSAPSHVIRVRVRSSTGVYHWAQGQAGPFLDSRGATDGIIVSFRLVDAEVAAEEVLLERAQHDDLTGLLNRAELTARLSARLRDQPTDGQGLAVAFCDLDGFKAVNDSRGHAVGDEVLRVVASRMTAGVRRDDLVGRFGGDEMLVVLDGVPDLATAVGVADKLRLRTAVPIALSSDRIQVTLSVGVALARPGESFDQLVARADDAMFAAKHSGRNRVVAAPAQDHPQAP